MLAGLKQWRDACEQARQLQERNPALASNLSHELTPCLRRFVWAAGRLGVGRDLLIELASARFGHGPFRPIRLDAVMALTELPPSPDVTAALEAAAVGDDPEVRALAAGAIARNAPERAPELAGKLLSDRISFQRLAPGDGARLLPTLRRGASDVHVQGIVLPDLIRLRDVAGIAACAEDRTLPEVARLGAVEALAALADSTAEATLRVVGLDETTADEVRKAAWRGLRRSIRARAVTNPTTPGAEVKT